MLLEEAKLAAKQALEVKTAAIAKKQMLEAELEAAEQAEKEALADFEEAAVVAAAAKEGSDVPYSEALAILQAAEEVKVASAALTELAKELAKAATEEERDATALAEKAAQVITDLETGASNKKRRRILEEESEDEKADEDENEDEITTRHKKLKATVPWLQIPDSPNDLETNTWAPNWRSFGKSRGDVRYFFGPVIDDPEEKDPTNDDNEGNMRTMQDFQPSPITSALFDAYHKKWESYKGMGSNVLKNEALKSSSMVLLQDGDGAQVLSIIRIKSTLLHWKNAILQQLRQ